eukprot:c21454_g1_i1 orf=505-1422(-)
MNYFLRRTSVLRRQASPVLAYPGLPVECSVARACVLFIPHVLGSGLEASSCIRHAHTTSSLHVLDSGDEGSSCIRFVHMTSSLHVLGSGVEASSCIRHVHMASSPYIMGSGGEASSCIRHVHTTSYQRGAASKLKEAPLDSSEDIDLSKPADYNPSNHDAAESRSAPSEKILQLVNEIANLTLLEASDLSYLLKKKLGLPDSAMPYYGGGMVTNMGGALSGGASAAAEEEKLPEKTNFDVKLEKYEAAAKIKVIKEVRTFTSLGLKEAKELVEKLPAVLKSGVGKEEAEQMIEKLKAVGATAVLE